MARLESLLFVLVALATIVNGLKVTPGSSCATFCMDSPDGNAFDPASSSTNSSDIACSDPDYSTTDTGIKFKQCLQCLQKSAKVNGTESDVSWYLYNLRYSMDVCLFNLTDGAVAANGSSPTSGTNSPCLTSYACLPLKNALLAGISDPNGDTYDYCTANSSIAQQKYINWCISCLENSPDQYYMSNFVTALQSGCQQKPTDGHILGLTGDLFTNSPINITDVAAPPPPTSSTNASSSTMTIGTIVGIAVGAALLFLGGATLFIIYWRRQKKQNQELQDAANDPDNYPFAGSGGLGPNPMSDKSLGLGPYIPMSSHKKSGSFRSVSQQGSYMTGESGTAVEAYAHNADYYDKLEEEYRSRQYHFDPHRGAGGHGPNSAIPTHPAYIPRALSREARNTTPSPQPSPQPSFRAAVSPPLPRQVSSSPPRSQQSRQQRGTSPQPPPAVTTAAAAAGTESYALRAYLNSSDDAPGGPLDHSRPTEPQPAYQPPAASFSRPTAPSTQQQEQPAAPLANIPPPPPRQPKVPTLSLAVPKLKSAPRKYSPPQIVVEGATPIDGPSSLDNRNGNMRITAPLSLMDTARFPDQPLAGGVVYGTERPRREVMRGDMPLGSGKSALYG